MINSYEYLNIFPKYVLKEKFFDQRQVYFQQYD